MPVTGADYGVKFGPSLIGINGISNQAMAALNTGVAFRFLALNTKDIKSFRLRWASVTAAGTVQLRIETVDAATGKPTGTLYDANAVYNITPVAGVQTYTFATLPTTGLVVGNMYAVVLLTTVAGTTQTLAYGVGVVGSSTYPVTVMSAADGTTRTNFVEITNVVGACSFVLDDDTEELLGHYPYANTSSFLIYGVTAGAGKFNLPVSLNIAGVYAGVSITGTPAGDLRIRIFDSSDNVVSGTTTTLDKDGLLVIGTATRTVYAPFTSIITLSAGNYRVVIDSPNSINSTNCYSSKGLLFFSLAAVGTNFRTSTTTDVTVIPITWTDSNLADASVALNIDSIPAASGGGMLVHPGLAGGMNG